MKSSKLSVVSFITGLVLIGAPAGHAQQASVQMAKEGADVAGGQVLRLNVKLDKPLPPETSVIARVRPQGVSQLIVLSSMTPDNAARTEVIVSATLPNVLVPGEWQLQDVFIVLPETNIWQSVGHNELTFEVAGKPFAIPTKADVSVAK